MKNTLPLNTLLIGFDSAWTADSFGALVGVLRREGGELRELGPPRVVNYAEAELVIRRLA